MKKILLTGSSNGFGKEIRNKFLNNKYKVYSLTKNKDNNLDKKLNNYFPEYVNFNNFKNLNIKLDKVIKKNTKFDFIILNAGIIGPLVPTKYLRIDELKKVLNINVYSNKIIIDKIIEKKIKFKSIIAISSGAAIASKFGWYSYSASKALLKIMFENYALENNKLHFINYAPGIIDTNMQKIIRATSSTKIPSVKKFKLLHKNNELLTPKDAANTLYLNLKKISKLKSGMFIDARTF